METCIFVSLVIRDSAHVRRDMAACVGDVEPILMIAEKGCEVADMFLETDSGSSCHKVENNAKHRDFCILTPTRLTCRISSGEVAA